MAVKLVDDVRFWHKAELPSEQIAVRIWSGSRHQFHRASLPLMTAGSPVRRNTGIESLCWGFVFQGLTWPLIELTRGFVQISLRVYRQVGSFREVLPQQSIGVLVGAALPRTLRVTEVDVDIGRQGKTPMIGKLLAPAHSCFSTWPEDRFPSDQVPPGPQPPPVADGLRQYP